MRLVHDLARRSADDAESNLKVFRATLTRTLPIKVGKNESVDLDFLGRSVDSIVKSTESYYRVVDLSRQI